MTLDEMDGIKTKCTHGNWNCPDCPELRTCQHCKFWLEEKYPSGFVYAECKNQTVTSMIQAETFEDFSPPADFGCNRWERKV